MNEQVVPERAPSTVETSKVDAAPSAPITRTPDLPPIAADADDLRVIRQAVNDAASVSGALWVSYLFVLFYLAIAAGAVTHADLFFENPVKLPFLNIELPLLAFFFLAPILFLIVHAYTLVHLVMLTNKAKRFDEELYRQIGQREGVSDEELKRRAAIRTGLRRELPSNIFVQFFAGPADVRESSFGWLLRTIAWSTLVVAPVLLLLLIQIQFLPFHSTLITWIHRIALLADLGLIWWLWSKILSGREFGIRRRGASWAWTGFGLALSVCAVLFCWTAATFPGEWQEEFLARWDKPRLLISLHDWAFNLPVDGTTRRRSSFFSSTLILSGLNIYEGLNIDDPEKAKWRSFVFRARGRDLKGAIFDLANLPKVDFTGAELQGASLNGAQLQRASFDNAQLQRAALNEAQLQGASLEDAQLQGAKLFKVQLQGASLITAQLQGAVLYDAQLQGATLFKAQLQGALLHAAQLQGASLEAAQLQGASLEAAQLQGASLNGAELQGASLNGAELQGASLQNASLEATDLSGARLWRISGHVGKLAAVRLPDSPDQRPPSRKADNGEVPPWNDRAYQGLRQMMESVPPGALRDDAINRIRSLDCANPDPSFASCDPLVPLPAETAALRTALENARADDATYAKALAAVLRTLVCSGSDNAAYVLRGLESPVSRRPTSTGSEAPALVDFIMSKDCPVSASLTENEKARLIQIKQEVIKAAQDPAH
jgi:uncharacterized protein YjbI with pentapeptide repeats